MSRDGRADARTQAMVVATKQAMQEMTAQQEVDKLPGTIRELLGELRALVGMSDLCRLVAIKRIQQIKQYCLDHRINWERVCEEALPKCRRSIDHYLNTLETFGDGTYEAIIELTTHAERVAARRLMKDGTIRQEDGAIFIGSKRILNDAAHTHQIVEVLREVFAQRDAAVIEVAREKDVHQRQAETAEKREAKLHELLDAKAAEVTALRALSPPPDLATDVDRESWRAARQALGECDLHVSALAALAADPTRTDVLRARVVGHLRTLQGWIQAAVDEIAEQMPPEWAPTIEAEEADCALAPALPREVIEEVRQRIVAKGGLTLVPAAGGDNGHSAEIPTGAAH